MTMIREKALFDALAAVSRSFAEDGIPSLAEAEGRPEPASGTVPDAAVPMDPEVREALGEAATTTLNPADEAGQGCLGACGSDNILPVLAVKHGGFREEGCGPT